MTPPTEAQAPTPEPSEEDRELLGCPFCGGAEIGLLRPCTETHAQRDWYIQCYGCNVETAEYGTRTEVIAAWNARALSRGGHTLVDADEAIAAIKEAVTTLSPRQEAKDAEKWMALAAAFGPILKEAFPDYSSIERMRVGEALADAVKIRVEWFRPKGGNVTTPRLAASSREELAPPAVLAEPNDDDHKTAMAVLLALDPIRPDPLKAARIIASYRAALALIDEETGFTIPEALAHERRQKTHWFRQCRNWMLEARRLASAASREGGEAKMVDALQSIRQHCGAQPSALARAIVATCNAALASPAPMPETCPTCETNWQPIETAPKDGAVIFLTSTSPRWKYPFPARWNAAHDWWEFADAPLNDVWAVSDLVDHWMPLPAPPHLLPEGETPPAPARGDDHG